MESVTTIKYLLVFCIESYDDNLMVDKFSLEVIRDCTTDKLLETIDAVKEHVEEEMTATLKEKGASDPKVFPLLVQVLPLS